LLFGDFTKYSSKLFAVKNLIIDFYTHLFKFFMDISCGLPGLRHYALLGSFAIINTLAVLELK